MSRGTVHSVTLVDGKTKVLILDRKQIPDKTDLYNVIQWGKPLPKGTKPGPEHICIAKQLCDNTVGKAKGNVKPRIELTMSEKGAFKHHWDEGKLGPKPKRERKPVDPAVAAARKAEKAKAKAEMDNLKAQLAAIESKLAASKPKKKAVKTDAEKAAKVAKPKAKKAKTDGK